MSIFNAIKEAAHAMASMLGRVPASSPKVTVGNGASNEFQILISGIPNLFRDEGDHIVHFVAVFDSCIQNTSFGHKVLPIVVPRWDKVGVERGPSATPQSVALTVMREAKARTQSGTKAKTNRRTDLSTSDDAVAIMDSVQATPREATASQTGYAVGRLLEWGEMKFPNRKPGGKPSFTSFAVRLETAEGEKTLQGEGLKEPIANLGCEIGDRVSIKRLHKEKVLAFDHETGRPIIDPKTRKQKFYDRWVWQMHRIH